MNVTRKPWDDPRIRKAAMYAINRQDYIERVYQGDARPNGLIHWGLGDFALPEEELEQLQPYDPERSKQLIREAGYELPLRIKVMFPANSTIEEHNQHLPIFLEQMEAAGFQVEQDAQDFGTWLDNYRDKNYDASLALNQVYETPEIVIGFQHSKGPAGSEIYSNGLQDPEVDAAIDRTKEILDQDELVQALHDVQRLIYEKGPTFLPIVSPLTRTLYWNFVKDVPQGLGSAGLFVNTWWLDL
jgi:peptide/nickel transport system substrate-binding protein